MGKEEFLKVLEKASPIKISRLGFLIKENLAEEEEKRALGAKRQVCFYKELLKALNKKNSS